ncbi:MAG: hypothetical protein ACI9S8_002788 [Chlamydiales bacterium]|jgi:hypothetical protein
MAEEAKGTTGLDKAVDQLVDSVMKNLEEGYDNPMLPFALYVERTKMEVEHDVKEFRMRLRKGYLAILYALRDKKGMSKEQKKKIVKDILSNQINTLSGEYRIDP